MNEDLSQGNILGRFTQRRNERSVNVLTYNTMFLCVSASLREMVLLRQHCSHKKIDYYKKQTDETNIAKYIDIQMDDY